MKRYIDLYFTTATILGWYPLLKEDRHKDVIIESFRFIVEQKRATIWAFVIMDTHIHLIWQILHPYELWQVRRDMLKYTSQTIKNDIVRRREYEHLDPFLVRKKDRHVQIWMKKPLSVVILNDHVLQQKLNYIHTNLTQKGGNDINYKYSSASYYSTGIKNWDFI